ncbi:hypothetical protein [Nocardia niwae]|uniref:hypothetical protein n=1 Tax=Nocardia niwae TaxID=626084 RepID=UPI0012F50EF9|nr:hypothetical protein [Nocardia niwae]
MRAAIPVCGSCASWWTSSRAGQARGVWTILVVEFAWARPGNFVADEYDCSRVGGAFADEGAFGIGSRRLQGIGELSGAVKSKQGSKADDQGEATGWE